MRKETGQGTAAMVMAGVLAVFVIVVLFFAFPAYSRYQKRANANNNVKVSEIEIRNQAQRVQIAKQKAEIRRQDAIGIREAQDQIAKTLTPLYVQFEMTEALKAIAVDGTNNTTVYIPAGPSGVPLIGDVSGDRVKP